MRLVVNNTYYSAFESCSNLIFLMFCVFFSLFSGRNCVCPMNSNVKNCDICSPTSIDNTTNRDIMIIIVIWMIMMKMITKTKIAISKIVTYVPLPRVHCASIEQYRVSLALSLIKINSITSIGSVSIS